MTRVELWLIVERLEAVGLAHTTEDSSSNTTSILLHPGIKLDITDMDQGLVVEETDIPFGGPTAAGMMCTSGGRDPEEWLDLVIDAHEGFAASWGYVLIDEGRADFKEPDDDEDDA